MQSLRIGDLPAPVTAAKADWLVADGWIGFTPIADGPKATGQCQSVINGQAANGYVIEYVTLSYGTPNPGHEKNRVYLKEREAHKQVAGRLVAVHKLRATARKLLEVVGEARFNDIQDRWAEDGKRRRWSVAFPIVESYEILGKPLASKVFDTESYKRLFMHPSATLRPLVSNERAVIAELELLPRETSNAWIAIEDEIRIAERSHIDENILQVISADLPAFAIEGITSERWQQLRRRAAWLAQRFVILRTKAETFVCDDCHFDPASRTQGTSVRPRSLLDVHHLRPLQEGVRPTSIADFSLLCPTCHRLAHALLRA